MPEASFSFGLVGTDIAASLSPAMHEREGRAQGFSLSYRLIDAGAMGLGAENLPELLTWAERLGFDGLNVTHPFKQAVVPLLDDLSEAAHDLGAVNTVVFDDGRRLGRNTDWSGFSRALRRALPGADSESAIVVGAGGAGVAVAYGLLAHGAAHVSIHDVDLDRADDAVVRLSKRFGEDRVDVSAELDAGVAGAAVLVNATPVGMHGHPGTSVPAQLLRPDLRVADVVYFPLRTELLAAARAAGCRVMSGGGMAVEQAVGAFELFTGRMPDADRMHAHFDELTA